MKRIWIFTVVLLLVFSGCKQATPSVTEPPLVNATEPMQTVPPVTEPVVTEPVYIPSPAELLLQTMSTEEKVGQLFFARCPASDALADIRSYHLGGYVLFGVDFQDHSIEQMQHQIAAYQAQADIPLLVGVDEEGGIVTRISDYTQFRSTPFPSPRSLYNQGGLDRIAETEAEKCQLLKTLGINVNLAPVCDITTDPNAFMYSRSLGQGPEITGQFITRVLEISAQYQIGNVLKHFPGYGNNADTHTGIAVDNRSLAELESNDLLPFVRGIDAGCGAIMVSHTFVNCLDALYPASLSPAVHNYLRNDMGFDGVIATDDLFMNAITDLYGTGEAAVLAVLAGNDLLCCTEYQVQYEAVLQAVQSERISEAQLNQAVLRILHWKYDLGLLCG